MIIVKCKECNKKFYTYKCKILSGRGKYCSKNCSNKNTLIKKGQRLSIDTEFKIGVKPYSYKGFTITIPRVNGRKYRLIYNPNHPYCSKKGYVREHRLVMENFLGRFLLRNEIVHHKDGNTLNNEVSNLEVMNKREHDRMNVPLNVHKRWIRGDAQ